AREPADRQLDHRMASGLGELLELCQRREVRLAEQTLAPRPPGGEAGAFGRLLARTVLPGEEAAGERKVGKDPEAVLFAGRRQLTLDAPVEQVVLILRGDEGREVLH